MLFPIETNIPLPKLHNGRKVNSFLVAVTETAKRLEVGQSFFVPADSDAYSPDEAFKYMNRLRNRMHIPLTRARKGTSKKFSVRKLDSGVRIWRTE